MRLHRALIAFACLLHLGAHAQQDKLVPDAPDLASKPRQGSATGVIPPGASPAGERPSYGIRQDADIGSNVRRNAVTGLLPFDKRYEELTPEQKDIVRSQYEKLAPGDEPPFPVKGLGTIYKGISVAQNAMQVKGKLSIFVEVSSQGEPLSVSVLQSPDKDFTRAVATILMREKYKPALCDGKPCQMGFPVRLTLEMR